MRCFCLAVFLSSALWAQEIPSGTHLLLSLEQNLNTSRAKAGDHVALRVTAPLVASGTIVIPVGSYAEGVLTQVKRSGRLRGRAELRMQLLHFVTPDGKVIENTSAALQMKQNFGDSARSSRANRASMGVGGGILIAGLAGGAATGSEIGVQAGIFGSLGFGVLQTILRRGADLDLPRGTTLDFVTP